MRCLCVLLVLLLAGCVSEVPKDTSRYFTIEHGRLSFFQAEAAARTHCTRLGMDARHLGTDGGRLSRFECIAR